MGKAQKVMNPKYWKILVISLKLRFGNLIYSLTFSVVPCSVFYEGTDDGEEEEE
jgi:hypothetical protein